MAHPFGESLPDHYQLVESPAQLPGFAPLEIGHTVEITRLGIELPDQPPAAEDVVSIVVGPYKGRAADGAPLPYGGNLTLHTDAARILDVSSLPVTVGAGDDGVPIKPNFVLFHWEGVACDFTPQFTPLFPDVEYGVTDPVSGTEAATFTISEEGALAVTRPENASQQTADVHVVGATLNSRYYLPRPARGSITPAAAAVQNTLRLGRGLTQLDPAVGNLTVSPGRFDYVDPQGAAATITFQRAFAVLLAEPGLFESYVDDTIATRQRKK